MIPAIEEYTRYLNESVKLKQPATIIYRDALVAIVASREAIPKEGDIDSNAKIEALLASLKGSFSVRSIHHYRLALRTYYKFLLSKKGKPMFVTNINLFGKYLREQDYTPSTIASYQSALRSVSKHTCGLLCSHSVCSEAQIMKFIRGMPNKYGIRTLKNYRTALRAYARFHKEVK
jgi:site-specific recombinase XerC